MALLDICYFCDCCSGNCIVKILRNGEENEEDLIDIFVFASVCISCYSRLQIIVLHTST